MMNWYFLSKIASVWRNDNDVLSSEIDRKIFSIIKQNIGKSFAIDINNIKNSCKISLIVRYIDTKKIDFKLRYNTFDIDAELNAPKDKSFKIFDPFIRVELIFSNEFSSLHFSNLFYILIDAIRHEIEHYHIYNKTGELVDDDMPYEDNYFDRCIALKNKILSSNEIVPYLRGLVFSSKKQKMPFSQVLDENLNGLFFYNDSAIKNEILSSVMGNNVIKIIEEIKNRVISETRKIFPKLRI